MFVSHTMQQHRGSCFEKKTVFTSAVGETIVKNMGLWDL